MVAVVVLETCNACPFAVFETMDSYTVPERSDDCIECCACVEACPESAIRECNNHQFMF